MSVDEDLVAACVPEAASLLLVAEQRVRDLEQRVRESWISVSGTRSSVSGNLASVLSCVS